MPAHDPVASEREATLARELAELRARCDAAEARLAAARAESAFLYRALEEVPVGLELYGADGTALWLNRAMVEFVGLPSAEVAVGRFNILTDPFSVQTGMVDWYRRAYAGEVVRTEEFSIDLELARIDWGTSSKRIRFRMVLVPRLGEGGAVESVLAIMYEVTQQHVVRRISEKILHSERASEACRHIAEGLVGELGVVSATVWLYRSEGAVTAAASAPHEPSEPPSWLAEAEAARATIVREGDGEPNALGAVAMVVTPVVGPQGAIGFLEVGSATRYATAQALPAALERLAEQLAQFDARYRAQRTFEAVFSRTPDAIAFVSPSGDVRLANESAARLFGPRATHVARMFAESARVEGLIARAVADSGAPHPSRADLRAIDASDREFDAEVACSFVEVAAGAPGVALVARDLTERKAMQASLERSLREKDTLLREVHHRVKNNLQVVSSLLSMQADGLDDGPARRALGSSVERVLAMSLVHQQLYDGSDFERIALGEYVRSLVGRLQTSVGPLAEVDLRLGHDELWVALDEAVPLGLLLNELFTNAIKHGRGSDGRCDVAVHLERTDGGFSLSIADRGSQVSAAPSPRSLGLQLVKALARQLGAVVVREARSDGPGTSVTVRVERPS